MTGQTSLIYKGNDGTARTINPASYQPAGSYAAASHNHSAANITSGTLAVARGGTGQTSVDTTPTSGSKKMCTSGGIYTAINDLKTSVSNGKSLIASAITDKGVSTASSATFQTMANNIGKISTIGYQNLNSVNGTLITADTKTNLIGINTSYSPFIFNIGTNVSSGVTYFNIKANGYTKVYLTSTGYSYYLKCRIYKYNISNVKLWDELAYIKGSSSTTSYQNLGFTMSSSATYMITIEYEVGSNDAVQFA